MVTTLIRCRRAHETRTDRRPYLDNHATTPLDRAVRKAMERYWSRDFGNPGSSTHAFGWVAKEGVERGRENIAAALGVEPDEVIFTSGATESNNTAIKGLAAACNRTGHMITQPTEHKCVLESFRRLEQQGWLVTYLPVDRFARVAPDDLRRAIRGNTALVSVMAANNEVGTLQPIRELAGICRERGIVFHTDAAQAVGKIDLDLHDVPVDMLSLSGHKIYGPKGVGALVVKGRGTRVRLRPIIDGGDQEFGLRAGTLPVPLIAGLGVACQLCRELQPVEAVRIQRQRDRLWEGLRARVHDVVLNGHPTERLPGNLNVSFPGVDPKRLLCNLDAIAVSAGSACNSAKLTPSHVLTAMGVAPDLALSTIRFGLGRFTTDADIEEAIEVVVDAARRSRTG